MHRSTMRTTLDLNEDLIRQAKKLTHIEEKTALIHEALRVLIAKAAQQDLATLGGSQKKLKRVSRRKAA